MHFRNNLLQKHKNISIEMQRDRLEMYRTVSTVQNRNNAKKFLHNIMKGYIYSPTSYITVFSL